MSMTWRDENPVKCANSLNSTAEWGLTARIQVDIHFVFVWITAPSPETGNTKKARLSFDLILTYCHSSFILPAHPSFSTAHLHTETSSRNISSCMAHGVARLPLCWWTVCLADFPLTGLKKCGSLEAKKAMATEWEKLNLGRHEERAQIRSCWCCL